MDTNQLETALTRLFEEENHRIVFWNDPDQEFLTFMNSLPMFFLEGVNVVRLDREGALQTKIRIEREEPDAKFLFYTPAAEPDYDDDWLLDIRLYSRSFRADRASIILEELGLTTRHLRDHLAQRRKFLDAKERLQKLKPLVLPEDTADELDRKMLAVVVKADQSELYNILRTLFHLYAEVEDIDLRQPIPAGEQIEKFDLAEPFWRFVKKAFGYADETPTLENLLIRLLVTDFAQHLHGEFPAALEHLVLPLAGRANAVVYLAGWRDSASKGSSYDLLSEYVANLFYNLARRTMGLVGVWDVVAFDEVAGISFKDKDGVRIMKDDMARRANSDTLGFLPDGAFSDYASEHGILVALDSDGTCVGYSLYRVAKDRATIAHLCIADTARGQGHAAALVRHLVATTGDLRGIGFRCRRDFPAYSFWPKFGFTVVNEAVSTGTKRRPGDGACHLHGLRADPFSQNVPWQGRYVLARPDGSRLSTATPPRRAFQALPSTRRNSCPTYHDQEVDLAEARVQQTSRKFPLL